METGLFAQPFFEVHDAFTAYDHFFVGSRAEVDLETVAGISMDHQYGVDGDDIRPVDAEEQLRIKHGLQFIHAVFDQEFAVVEGLEEDEAVIGKEISDLIHGN